MSDQAELARMMAIHGLGEPIFDEATNPEDIQDFLADLGVDADGTHPSR